MNRIKYFAYYGFNSDPLKRNYVLSAVNKINYIVKCINANGIGVDLVSFSGLTGDKWSFSRSRVTKNGMNTYRLFLAFSGPHLLQPIFRFILTLQFIIFLMFNCKKGEKIIVYHSLGYDKIFNIINKIKRFKIIGEIEEIYQDVINSYSKSRKINEYRFIKNCYSYIFPSKLLAEKLDVGMKPFVVVHGTYEVKQQIVSKFNDGKIHLVYAGTFDPNKGGAQIAISTAKYLPSKFHIHIVGFGSASDIENIKRMIAKTNKESQAKISYDGLLFGIEFETFLQKCHIGLSTQNPNDAFNDTSFPSKILTYMANGLSVASFNIDVLKTSSLNDFIYYAESYEPSELAKSILSMISTNELVDTKRLLESLDIKFKKDISLLLDDLS